MSNNFWLETLEMVESFCLLVFKGFTGIIIAEHFHWNLFLSILFVIGWFEWMFPCSITDLIRRRNKK